MSKHDLRARPIYHRLKRESIDAHLSIVFAALAVSRLVEDRTGWSIRRFVRTPAATAPSISAPPNTYSPPATHFIGDADRPRQPPDPRNDLAVVWAEPALEQFPGLPVQPARHDRARVRVQSDTRTIPLHWGLPHLRLYRAGPLLPGNPRSHVVRPQPGPPYRLSDKSQVPAANRSRKNTATGTTGAPLTSSSR